MASHGASLISTSAVENSLSSLRNCQAYIDTGMEITTGVALDLIQNGGDAADVDSMESVMLEYAVLNRDLNHYISAVEETVRQVKRDQPEDVPDLRQLVHQTYNSHRKQNTDEALKKSNKFVNFKEQIRDLRKQMGISQGSEDGALEDDDEEIAVTQSTANFTCPITQMEMVNPVKNKACGHTYEREAIEKMIQSRHRKNKNIRCPTIGCDVSDMSVSDLVPDTALKRAIDIHKRQSQSKQ
ncbi:E3 SUMO-protein ligase NSE2 isoform X1 [Bufo gargarizans]|uniref:E3 SUMO-protein ligase NSE2 isoform X1 n=1 Tax=Bufo gargarizans TaxID=30331 RepID=UPI001CF2B778|nr:E3 SUMO-protein ligase NSE2 isoform X1 [Bufo gargarizans]XP_044148706.1 E3 SUMO-protein ligase NSE2 isoform X1 [Bufo gargarizans]